MHKGEFIYKYIDSFNQVIINFWFFINILSKLFLFSSALNENFI